MATDMNMAPFLPSQTDVAPAVMEQAELSRLRRMVEESWSITQTGRDEANEDRRMFDGQQLSATTKRILKKRGQPEVVDNLIRPAVMGLLGVIDQSRTDPRAFPRNPQDDQSADVATKALRFAAEKGNFDKMKLISAKEYFIRSTGAMLIEIDPDMTVTYTPIDYDEYIYDPHSKRLDFSDSRYHGVGKWFYVDDVRALYSEQWELLGDPLNVGPMGGIDSMGDKPGDMSKWVDRIGRRVMVVELYYRQGADWIKAVFCAAGALEVGKSPYVDDKGRSICPIEAVSYDIDNDNKRYSHVRGMVSLQHSVNSRKSRLGHLTNTRQIQRVDQNAAPVDADIARAEAAKADGVIPPGWQVVGTADLSSGQANLLQDDRSQLQRMGPTPAVLGRQEGSSQSGRARLVLQQAGMTELAPSIAGVEDLEERCYRQTWYRMKQFWTGPMWVRVTDNTKAPEFLQINEPAMDEAGMPVLDTDEYGRPKMQPVAGPDGQPVVDPQTGQPAMQPVQKVNNRLADLDMDIIIGTTPDVATLEMETFGELVKLSGGNLQAITTPEFELWLEASPLAEKARIIELVKKKREEMQNSQEQQMIQQLQARVQELEQGKTAAETEKVQAQIANIQTDTLIDSFKAGIETAQPPQMPTNEGFQPQQ